EGLRVFRIPTLDPQNNAAGRGEARPIGAQTYGTDKVKIRTDPGQAFMRASELQPLLAGGGVKYSHCPTASRTHNRRAVTAESNRGGRVPGRKARRLACKACLP